MPDFSNQGAIDVRDMNMESRMSHSAHCARQRPADYRADALTNFRRAREARLDEASARESLTKGTDYTD